MSDSPSVTRSLEAAIAALVGGAGAATALPHVLAAWRALPAAEIAALVSRAGRRCPSPPLGGRTPVERRSAWQRIATARRAADVDTLLLWLGPDSAESRPALAYLNALVPFGPDPRIATRARRWLELPTLPARERAVAARLAAPINEPVSELPPHLAARVAQLRELLDAPDDDALTDERGAALLAAVYADPDAVAPRLVYADHLLERGDPRGELIMLQCNEATAGDPRALALVEQMGDAWLGPLARVVQRITRHFERGFLSIAELRVGDALEDDEIERILDDPAWSTVRALNLLTGVPRVGEAMRHLRRLEGLPGHALARLLRSGSAHAWQLEWVRVRGAFEESAENVIAQLADPSLLPHLQELELDVPAELPTARFLLVWHARPSLRRLVVTCGGSEELSLERA